MVESQKLIVDFASLGLGPEYFRQLLQSNCGVSVLDFTPRTSGDGPPYVCLDRLNQALSLIPNNGSL
jgi:hypothetical protein